MALGMREQGPEFKSKAAVASTVAGLAHVELELRSATEFANEIATSVTRPADTPQKPV